MDPDQTPRSVVSDLALPFLPMSLSWDTRHKWVKCGVVAIKPAPEGVDFSPENCIAVIPLLLLLVFVVVVVFVVVCEAKWCVPQYTGLIMCYAVHFWTV